ncbi:hypothetical protein [Truepera radiovictrix]|uniref:Transcriptional regulator domain protein n=1 Tax=Truepera radiovictrix (strain DSM 17093 / CIP 108686 / LMG 22925 / RQ-24) TaxID=649638 RepID=D7CWX7_TRURR|nr:hypothetical protein [Truepera radiovictrix]ADI14485.1 transcriptional regulator domain protein [Truepera radiovictrix DSM 17093]WMT56962.1 hypothetical protein RCV51_13205 [Truepera radiovictrix]
MWLQRLLARIHGHPGPILIEGGEAYGGPFLIDALRKVHRVAWLQLAPADAGDPVALGNRLAEAVNSALEATFLPYALPYTYSTELLKRRLPLLGPLFIALSNAEFSPPLRDALLELSSEHAKVIALVSGTAPLGVWGLHLKQAELALSLEEAETLAGPFLTPSERETLWRSSGGAYLTFISSVRRLRGEALPHVPSPQGELATPGAQALVAPELLLEVLMQLGRYTEALDLAVMSLPERVAEILKEAGPVYQDQGLLARLHLLLESLEAPARYAEEVLEWRLVAAYSQSAHQPVLTDVARHLAEHEAPNLRARYAGTLSDPALRFAEAQRAAAAQATPITLYQLGRLHPDPSVGVALLKESVRLAEKEGRPYDVVRNAGGLAERLIHDGNFTDALSWGEWALEAFDRHQLKDGQRRLRLLNGWAYARLLCGQTNGLYNALAEARHLLESTHPSLAVEFRSTLAELSFVLGRFEEARELCAENLRQSSRQDLGRFAVLRVRLLLEEGEVERAVEEGRRVVALTGGEDPFYALPAALALGMGLAVRGAREAEAHLRAVLDAAQLEADLRLSAALYLMQLGELEFAELPDALRRSLQSLSKNGLFLLSGPETLFAPIWETVLGDERPLRIAALGRAAVWLRNQPLELSERALEVLVLLALHPKGLSAEALHAKLYEDESTKLVALRSAVSRLRNLVPITSHPEPYKIAVPYAFDAFACEAALAQKDVRGALELYRGPLLPQSEAPGIREARLYLEEQLRQTVLLSGDPEALIPLAETLGDDAELWQAAHAALRPGDPRVPIVRAHLQRVARDLEPRYN